MAPPPITPSPHRFLTSQPSNAAPKPSSSLRFQQNATQPLSSQQFASAPRFNFSSTQKSVNEYATPATQFSSPLSRRPHFPPLLPAQRKEDIEETSSDREDDGSENNDVSDLALPTQPVAKRRRRNPSAPEVEAVFIASSSPSPTSAPTTPPHHTIEAHAEEGPSNKAAQPFYAHTIPSPPHQPPRFVLPHLSSTSTAIPPVPIRPPFLLPRSPTPPQPTALPPLFSPHRRGQKYTPGGLASTVRDWVVEMGQVAHQQHTKRAGGEGGGWDVRLRVAECVGGDGREGLRLVRGADGGRWVLVGRGEVEVRLEVGRLVGVKGAIWEVDTGEGKNWSVAVEWGVLDG